MELVSLSNHIAQEYNFVYHLWHLRYCFTLHNEALWAYQMMFVHWIKLKLHTFRMVDSICVNEFLYITLFNS